VFGLVVSFCLIGMNRIAEGIYPGMRDEAQMKVSAPCTLLGFAIMGIILSTWM
jgi:hypothetical protein